jgi:single-stranded-DNA-specific exonuclease
MPRPWRFAPHDRGHVAALCRELNCSPLLAQVLASRGVFTGHAARAFIRADMNDLHDPGLMPGINAAVDRITSAIQAGRRITIYGDYDVDGVTSTSILWHCLKLAGARVDYYIPCRMEEGYGLNEEAVRNLHAEDPRRLVITVDCGIGSLREAALARELGLELIVTDHHTIGEELPGADCIVHPRLPGGSYPFGELCGAGVALKVAWGVCQRLGDGRKASPRMREYLKMAVGLAAIGTVADVVPLVGENRIIVRYGLATLLDKSTPGLARLLKIAGLEDSKRLVADDIGFGLGPRLNAAGRLGQARLAVEMLTTTNEQRAAQLAEYIDQLNKDRQSVERRMFKEAKELVDQHPEWNDHPALVLAHPDWHPGVIGIVASRVVETYERPAIMIALKDTAGVGQGSCRSFAAFDLYTGLSACRQFLLGFGGHRAAAGLRISIEQIDAFRESFVQHVRDNHEVTPRDIELQVDAEVALADVTFRAIRELDQLGPFGAGHRKPIFAASRVELVEPPRKMGNGERHLSLRVRQGGRVLRAIAFGKADWAEEIARVEGPISICFTAGLNEYNGYQNIDLHLVDWQAAEVAPQPA